MSSTIPSSHRFSKRRPCPVCGGGHDLPSGRGIRCHGYLSTDGRYAHCTREQYAHGLPQESLGTFAHRLDGPCNCGESHAAASSLPSGNGHVPNRSGELPASAAPPPPRREVRREAHEIAGTDGRVRAIHRRIYFDDGDKKMWWERPGGAMGLGGIAAADLPPYGAHEWRPDRSTIHVEGEPARTALAPLAELLGYNVVAHVTGAPATHSDDALRPILGEKHFLWPDSDQPGETQMARTHDTLRSLLRDERGVPLTESRDSVLRIVWDGVRAGEGDDAADFVAHGGTPDDLARMIAQARPWSDAGAASDEPNRDAPLPPRRLVIRSLADVTPQPVDWLWLRWLARGKFHVFAGHPGARFRTLFVLGEDSLEDTLRPRLDLFGADVTQIKAIETVLDEQGRERFFDVAKHLDLLEDAVVAHDIGLLVIDPLSTTLVGSDRNAEGDTRDRLTPLVKLAERRDVAVLGIGHVGKPTGTSRTPLQRILGSTGLGALARLVWMTATAEDGMAVGPVKSNLAIVPDAHLWTREEDGPIAWHGSAGKKLGDLLDAAVPRVPRVDAEAFIREFLTGGSRPSDDIFAAAKDEGITERTLRRAADAIPVTKFKESGRLNGRWFWRLPDGQPGPPEPATHSNPPNLATDDNRGQVPEAANLATPKDNHVANLANFGESMVATSAITGHLHANTPVLRNGGNGAGENVMEGGQLGQPDLLRGGQLRAQGNDTVVETARCLAALTEDEMAAYRAELSAAAPNDPHIQHDREALALFDAMHSLGATA